MGDFNAKVVNERMGDVVNDYILGVRNEGGEKLTEWSQVNCYVNRKTWFKQRMARLYTLKCCDRKTRNKIDYMVIKNRFRNALLNFLKKYAWC